jgi:hypothetical protein
VFQFSTLESAEHGDKWMVVKANKNFAALAPKCLMSHIPAHQSGMADCLAGRVDGLVLEVVEGLPVVTFSQALIQAHLNKLLPSEVDSSSAKGAWGFLSEKKPGQGVNVRFLNGEEVQVSLKQMDKDLSLAIGQPMRVVKDAKAYSLKSSSLYDSKSGQGAYYSDKQILTKALALERKLLLENVEAEMGVKVGHNHGLSVKMAKDSYILVGSSSESQAVTGFVVEDHCSKEPQKYKAGEQVLCRVLDIDYEKKLADLSQVVSNHQNPPINSILKQSAKYPVNEAEKAVVELNKESYLIVSLKKNRNMLGLVNLEAMNGHPVSKQYQDL